MATESKTPEISLIATLPQAAVVATSLTIEGLGWHRSPGSAKHFHGRSIFLDLPIKEDKPAFDFLPEGGWRDAAGDVASAIKASLGGKKTKTGISNNALHVIPIDAPKRVFLVKTSGRALELQGPNELMKFTNHTCDENLTPDQVAEKIGKPATPNRQPRMYMILAPLEMLVLSTLSPEEYAWYASHRPGKVFRSVVFAEVTGLAQRQLISESVLTDAMAELTTKTKKTKTLVSGDLLNHVPFQNWIGYGNCSEGGLYFGDRNRILAWRFPAQVPGQWARADG